MRVDLNVDAGEGVGDSVEAALFAVVTSTSIACGVHAGDPEVMRATLRRGREHGLSVGAHPSFADREGFGRRVSNVDPAALFELVTGQIRTLAAIAAEERLSLQHVKPHGALYIRAVRDPAVARTVAEAVHAVNRELILVGPAGSALAEAGRAQGLRIAHEAFADRAYENDGALVDRRRPFAVLTDPAAAAAQAIRLVIDRQVVSVDGRVVPMEADTLCIHSDTPGAAAVAIAVREALIARGVRIAPMARVIRS